MPNKYISQYTEKTDAISTDLFLIQRGSVYYKQKRSSLFAVLDGYIPLAGSSLITGDLKYTKGSAANFGTADNYGLNIITNNTPRVTIDNAGFVGIGQTTPTSKLHLKGTTNDATAYSLKVDNSGDANIFSIRNDGLILMGSQTFSNTSMTRVLDLGSESGTVRGAFANNTKLRLSGDGISNSVGFGTWSDGTNGGVELQLSSTYVDYRVYQGAGLESWALLSENVGGALATRLTRRLGAGYGMGHYNSMLNSVGTVVDYSYLGSTAMVDTVGAHVGDMSFFVASAGTLTERLRVKGGGEISVNQFATINGTAGSGYIGMVAQSSNASAPGATGLKLFSASDGHFSWVVKNGSDTYVRKIGGTLTANRTKTLQDTTGTIAELTDIVNTYSFGYTLYNPAASTVYYFEGRSLNYAPATSSTIRRFRFLNNGILKSIVYNLYQNANGSAEDVLIYLRNESTTTDYLVLTYQSNFGAATSTGFVNDVSASNIAVNTTDLYTIKIVTPAWVTLSTQNIGQLVMQVKNT